MAMEIQERCPDCDGERTFWRVASTTVHLGEKVKWGCADCGHRFVRIDGDVDTSATA